MFYYIEQQNHLSKNRANIEHKTPYIGHTDNQSMFTMYDMSLGLLNALLNLQENTHPRIFQYETKSL